ncbi:MAG: response regulator transcription factor [Myxococcales bacterium]|nr:response regulator transcription factor [Myxococcales bacterium]
MSRREVFVFANIFVVGSPSVLEGIAIPPWWRVCAHLSLERARRLCEHSGGVGVLVDLSSIDDVSRLDQLPDNVPLLLVGSPREPLEENAAHGRSRTKDPSLIAAWINAIHASLRSASDEFEAFAFALRASSRERDALLCVVAGLSIDETARALEVSASTIRKHVCSLHRKARVSSTSGLVGQFALFALTRRGSEARPEA